MIRVLNVHDGAEYTVQCAPHDTVDHVLQKLQNATGIPVGGQVLLSETDEGVVCLNKLSRRPLPSSVLEGQPVFCFDRRALSTDAPAPDEPKYKFEERATAMSDAAASLTVSSSQESQPLLAAHPAYVKRFVEQKNQAEVLLDRSSQGAALCERFVQQAHNQRLALGVASKDLSNHLGTLVTEVDRFIELHTRRYKEQTELLATFDTSLSKLGTIRLHSALKPRAARRDSKDSADSQEPQGLTLLDFIPAQDRTGNERLAEQHANLGTSVQKLMGVCSKLRADAEELQQQVDKNVSEVISESDRHLETCKSSCAAQAPPAQALAADLTALVEHDSGLEESQLLAAVADWQKKYGAHAEVLKAMAAQDVTMESAVAACATSKHNMSLFAHTMLRKVSELSSVIKTMGREMSLYVEYSHNVWKNFSKLRRVKDMPTAYAAWEKEVARRRKYGRMVHAAADSVLHRGAASLHKELGLRESFLEEHGEALPDELRRLLMEQPPCLQVKTPPTASTLPAIGGEEDDIDLRDGVSALVTVLGLEGLSAAPEASLADMTRVATLEESVKAAEAAAAAALAQVEEHKLRANKEAELKNAALEELANLKSASGGLQVNLEKSMEELKKHKAETSSATNAAVIAAVAQAKEQFEATAKVRTSELEAALVKSREHSEKLGLEQQKQLEELTKASERVKSLEQELEKLKAAPPTTDLSPKLKEVEEKLKAAEAEGVLKQKRLHDAMTNAAKMELQLVQLKRQQEEHQSQITQAEQAATKLREQLRESEAAAVLLPKYSDALLNAAHALHVTEEVLLESGGGEGGLNTDAVVRAAVAIAEQARHASQPRVSFRNFQVNDFALFIRKERPGSQYSFTFEAFSVSRELHFLNLADRSLRTFLSAPADPPAATLRKDFVIGQLVQLQQEITAKEHDEYGIPAGTKYWVWTATLHFHRDDAEAMEEGGAAATH